MSVCVNCLDWGAVMWGNCKFLICEWYLQGWCVNNFVRLHIIYIMWHIRKSPVKLTSTMNVMSLCSWHLFDEEMTAGVLQSYKCRKWLGQFNLCTCLYFYLCFVVGQQKSKLNLIPATTVNDVLFYHGQLSKHNASLTDNAKSIVYCLGWRKTKVVHYLLTLYAANCFWTLKIGKDVEKVVYKEQ